MHKHYQMGLAALTGQIVDPAGVPFALFFFDPRAYVYEQNRVELKTREKLIKVYWDFFHCLVVLRYSDPLRNFFVFFSEVICLLLYYLLAY